MLTIKKIVVFLQFVNTQALKLKTKKKGNVFSGL